MIRKIAAGQPTPVDWCYVHNFKAPDQPKALSFPAGKAREFAREIEKLIDDLKGEIPKVFQSKDYETQRNKIEEDFGRLRDALTADLERKAQLFGFQINSTRLGIFAVPLHKGKPIQPEEFQKLDEATKQDIQAEGKELSEDIRTLVGQVRRLRGRPTPQSSIDESVVRYATEDRIEALAGKYADHPRVVDHVTRSMPTFSSYKDFLPPGGIADQIPGIEAMEPKRFDVKYRVNVLVDHSSTTGAPLVEETNPTYNNLIGRIEKKSRLGALYTDFTMIRAGSLLNAGGGFLVVNALDILRSPFSWDALKRVIKKNEIKIEDIGELYGFIATGGIKPEPIPVHVRVILTGARSSTTCPPL
jgi:predicted ATP-dependent protease